MAVLMMSVMLIAGCSSGEEASPGCRLKKAALPLSAFSISTLNNRSLFPLKTALKQKPKSLALTSKIVDAQNDPAKQANDVADLLQQGVSVLLVNPVDSAAISTSVEAANKAKIPVIALDRSADKGTIASLVASDNVKGGEMAAEYIIKKLGEGVKVAELEGIPRCFRNP